MVSLTRLPLKPAQLEGTVIVNGAEIKFLVNRPTRNTRTRARRLYREVFQAEIEKGTPCLGEMPRFVKKSGFWNKQEKVRHDHLRKKLIFGEYLLTSDDLLLEEKVEIARQMRTERQQSRELLAPFESWKRDTCEGRAEAAEMAYLLNSCMVYRTSGKYVFLSAEDCLRCSETKLVKAATDLMRQLLGLKENYVEEVFLEHHT